MGLVTVPMLGGDTILKVSLSLSRSSPPKGMITCAPLDIVIALSYIIGG